MADETLVRPAPTPTPAAEAAEIRAWRADKVRRLPRRARIWTWRLVAFCVGTVVLLFVVGEVLTFATSSIKNATHATVPRQR